MFDATDAVSPTGPAAAAGGVLDAATVAGWVRALAGLDRAVTDAERVEQLRVLEELKAAAAAAQARATVDLDTSVRAARAERGLPTDRQGAGVGAQVALARRESPHRGGRQVGFAHALVAEMPHTLAGLTDGWLSEWRATLIVQGTACLSREDRATVDRLLVADPAELDGVGDKQLATKVRDLAYRLDPQAALRRARKAEADRRVTIRPAPDTMVHLTALLPVKAGVAAYAALVQAAEAARTGSDPRGRGQVMADTLVDRLTGRSAATGTDLEVQVVLTDRTLLEGDHAPAHVPGYGPVPAGLARDWLRPHETGPTGAAETEQVRVWLRRLYTHPSTGQLVAMDSRRRFFDGALRAFLNRPGPDLSHLLVRRPDQARRPRRRAPRRRPHHRRRRAGPVRAVQPHQASTRLARPTRPRIQTRTPPRRGHHPHRTHLPLRRTTPTRLNHTTPDTDPAQQDRGPLPRPHPHRLTSRRAWTAPRRTVHPV